VTRRVLVVSYYFPPAGGVGVQRTLKFVEHLPLAGWEPSVVAPRRAAYRVLDPDAVGRLDPRLEVTRVLCIEPAGLRALARAGLSTLRGRPGGPNAARSAAGPARAGTAMPGWLNAAWAAWVDAVFVPDEQMLWVPAAATAAAAVHRRGPVDVVYSSGPPASTHLAAGLAAASAGVPWVPDFRDPWVGNAFARPRSPARVRLEAWMERWVVERAARIVFATPGLRARYAERYPARASRFAVIPNGYDRGELRGGPPNSADARTERPFRLVYAGSVYGERELGIFLDGLAIAVRRDPTLARRLRVEFIGWMSVPNQRRADAAAGRMPETIRVLGFRPRVEAVAAVRSADAALLLLADGPDRNLFVGGKLFEAIGLDRQVLAMAPEGDTRSILAELDWGVVVDPTPSAVADGLARLVASPLPRRPADPEGRYERRALAARLGEVLDQVVKPARGPEHRRSGAVEPR
jgi:glycosyltransferase involved in cell wall biosynthesis